MCFFTNIGKDYLLKTKKLLSVAHLIQIKQIYIEDFFFEKKFQLLDIPGKRER